MPALALWPLMAGMGFGVGMAGPGRNLLVRRAATSRFGKGSFGRVYGFVYSGLDAGQALSPLVVRSAAGRGPIPAGAHGRGAAAVRGALYRAPSRQAGAHRVGGGANAVSREGRIVFRMASPRLPSSG